MFSVKYLGFLVVQVKFSANYTAWSGEVIVWKQAGADRYDADGGSHHPNRGAFRWQVERTADN